MSFELLKVVCQVVAIERDESGVIVGERMSDPVSLYNADGFSEWYERVKSELLAAQNGAPPSNM